MYCVEFLTLEKKRRYFVRSFCCFVVLSQVPTSGFSCVLFVASFFPWRPKNHCPSLYEYIIIRCSSARMRHLFLLSTNNHFADASTDRSRRNRSSTTISFTYLLLCVCRVRKDESAVQTLEGTDLRLERFFMQRQQQQKKPRVRSRALCGGD